METVNRVKNILLSPKREWQVIEALSLVLRAVMLPKTFPVLGL